MRNFKNNKRRFRSNSFDRNFKHNSNDHNVTSSLGNVSDFKKKNFSRNNFNSSKLIQKYSDLAREALSNGDKILYENYLQHAGHFIRITDNHTNSGNGKNNSSSLNEINVSNLKSEETKEEKKVEAENN